MAPILPALVIALALLLYVALFMRAGYARRRYGVKAPAITGPPEFERAFRVQQNTLEQLVLFVPALWLFSLFVSPLWGTLIGLVWIAGRILYSIAYSRDPESRHFGFTIGLVASLALLLGALVGILVMLMRVGAA